jgi:hypothetical protein
MFVNGDWKSKDWSEAVVDALIIGNSPSELASFSHRHRQESPIQDSCRETDNDSPLIEMYFVVFVSGC